MIAFASVLLVLSAPDVVENDVADKGEGVSQELPAPAAAAPRSWAFRPARSQTCSQSKVF